METKIEKGDDVRCNDFVSCLPMEVKAVNGQFAKCFYLSSGPNQEVFKEKLEWFHFERLNKVIYGNRLTSLF